MWSRSPRCTSSRARSGALTVALAVAAALPSDAVALELSELAVPGGVAAVHQGRGGVALVATRDGRAFAVDIDGALSPAEPPTPPQPPWNAVPNAVGAFGNHDVTEAWLVEPTSRYDHGVLGDAIEAAALLVVTWEGRELRYELEPDSVFEDNRVRIVDFDRDRRDDLFVVRSQRDRGAALAMFGVRDGQLTLRAVGPEIGRAHRWLNPVGFADFDGDGRMEAAAVLTPHIGGRLVLYERRGRKLREDHAAHGFSNHAIGSPELGLSAVVDLNRDGVRDIAVPDASRRRLRVVSFAGGTFADLALLQPSDTIATAFAVLRGGRRVGVAFGLVDGTLAIAR